MSQATYFSVALAFGLSTTAVAIAPLAASAATVTFIQESDAPPSDWINLGWNIEGRAGVRGFADWEIGTKGDEASDPVEQLNLDWINGQDVPWTLAWNGSTVAFTVNGSTIDYTPVTTSSPFTGFYLWTRATTAEGKVDPGTSISLLVNQVNGISILPTATSSSTAPASGTSITKNFFLSDTAITSLSGTVTMSWLQGSVNPNVAAARSRIGFKIEGFSTPSSSVPEPLSILGLLMTGALGVTAGMKRRLS